MIIFSNLGSLPFQGGDFVFIILLVLALALYRPGWAFLILIGVLPLEVINLSPDFLPINLRPYQLLAFAVSLSLFLRFFFKKLNFSLPKWHWIDFLIIFLTASSFLSAFFSADKALAFKMSLIIASFVLIYFLARIYLQELNDLKRVVPFFLSSSLIVSFYGLWQNWQFMHGFNSFEVMPGRPNATFSEADWLGIYLVLLISLIASLVYFFLYKKTEETKKEISNLKFQISKIFFLWTSSVVFFSLLILTVSRSAWLGVISGGLFFLFLALTNLRFNTKEWDLKLLGKLAIFLFFSVLISLTFIYFLQLTNFELSNRLQSSSSGEQTITISCSQDSSLPSQIENVSELEQYGCRHINLEEIETEKTQGNYIKKINRPDPNFNIRSQIYQKSWQEIKNHWFLGIGWGNIGRILGADDRGASLNASNIFLEIYLGSGLIGFLSFLIIWVYIFLKNIWKFFFARDVSHKTLALFMLVALLGLTVANLFNSGIMLGFMWIFLSLALIKK